ncbi:SRPBCC family protein [Gynurincola endophyticus]|uniref:hypothetical protein n=1 Tax=Gynurincola endophyticus TaxID=2479004 RepID=UPI000F8CA72D|nr:hypothetical protein [Gynurincola endophyticus]
MKKSTFYTILFTIVLPVVYALIARVLFNLDISLELYNLMGITFIGLIPVAIGVIAINWSSEEKIKKISYRILYPWISILIFFVLTLLINLEGWACWVMILPIFLVSSSIGGLIAGFIRTLRKNEKLTVQLLILLPFFISPLEQMIKVIPGTYQAYTYIDIDAPAEKIWNNVTRVHEIPEEMDKGYLTRFLQFPRPVKAELDHEEVGGYREAIFTNGLVFHEKVTQYIHQKKMSFSITANPHEIPSTTLDKHIVIGGDYFDVLNGTYELEQLGINQYRLHLYSYFELKTTFNFYASWWARWIMQDIQNNILQVQKIRSESKTL